MPTASSCKTCSESKRFAFERKLSIALSFPSVWLTVNLSLCLFAWTYLSVCLSVCLSSLSLSLSQEEGSEFKCQEDFVPSNVMDRWIISFSQSLITFMREEMSSE